MLRVLFYQHWREVIAHMWVAKYLLPAGVVNVFTLPPIQKGMMYQVVGNASFLCYCNITAVHMTP